LDTFYGEEQWAGTGRGFTIYTGASQSKSRCSPHRMPLPQHQANQNALRQQTRNQPQQPINRIMNGMARQPGSIPPNGQLPNGIGPAGMTAGGQVALPNGVQSHMGFSMSNPSGHAPNGLSSGGPPQQQNIQQMMPGQRPIGLYLPF
jgi:collagen type III alpha